MKQSIDMVLKSFYDENGVLSEQALLSCLLSYATKEEVAKEHASMLLSRIGKLSLVLATPFSMLKEAGISESEEETEKKISLSKHTDNNITIEI